jgi:hypothetical protein
MSLADTKYMRQGQPARHTLEKESAMTDHTPLSRIADGAEFIGAGDEVAIIAMDGQSIDGFGILVDASDEATGATVNVNGQWVKVGMDQVAHADSPQVEAVCMFGTRSVLDAEPTTCPLCGSDDLGVFTADADTREDEADIVECEACKWTAGLTPEGVASLNEH